jgi:hypothetical protein
MGILNIEIFYCHKDTIFNNSVFYAIIRDKN